MNFFTGSTISTVAIDPTQAPACSRAALIVYRQRLGQPHFLLIDTRRKASRLTLPGGMVGRGEEPLETAIRETLEEAGVLCDRHEPLGRYPHHKSSGRVYLTQTYLARYTGYRSGHEPRGLHWLTIAELHRADLSIRKPIVQQVQLAAELLPAFIAAA